MTTVLFGLGVAAGAVLCALLLATLFGTGFRLWPTPGEKTWQSYVFWPLFRGLNLLCFAVAAFEFSDRDAASAALVHLPTLVRVLATIGLVGAIAVFLSSFFKLGRNNSYGAQDGLVTAGIYQWTRNPQNAMLIVVYACLALATGTSRTMLLCLAMTTVYHLMVLCEEPWLRDVYGSTYDAYTRRVPRYFNWRKLTSRNG